MRNPLLLQALMLAGLTAQTDAEREWEREVTLPIRRRELPLPPVPEDLRHLAMTRRFPLAAEVEHPAWSWPRGMRWGRACPACRREVAQGVKVCDRGHKPTKTRRVQLPK